MNKFNSIKMNLADRTIRGDFCNGEERKKKFRAIIWICPE